MYREDDDDDDDAAAARRPDRGRGDWTLTNASADDRREMMAGRAILSNMVMVLRAACSRREEADNAMTARRLKLRRK